MGNVITSTPQGLNDLFISCVTEPPNKGGVVDAIPKFVANWMISARESIEAARMLWHGYRYFEDRNSTERVLLSGIGQAANLVFGEAMVYRHTAFLVAVVERLIAVKNANETFRKAVKGLREAYSWEGLELESSSNKGKISNYRDSLVPGVIANRCSQELDHLCYRIGKCITSATCFLKQGFCLLMTIFDLIEIIWRRLENDQETQKKLNVEFFMNIDKIYSELDVVNVDDYYADHQDMFEKIISKVTGWEKDEVTRTYLKLSQAAQATANVLKEARNSSAIIAKKSIIKLGDAEAVAKFESQPLTDIIDSFLVSNPIDEDRDNLAPEKELGLFDKDKGSMACNSPFLNSLDSAIPT